MIYEKYIHDITSIILNNRDQISYGESIFNLDNKKLKMCKFNGYYYASLYVEEDVDHITYVFYQNNGDLYIDCIICRNSNDLKHNLNGPAITYFYHDNNKTISREIYVKNGKFSRLDGPAIINYDRRGILTNKRFMVSDREFTEKQYYDTIEKIKNNRKQIRMNYNIFTLNAYLEIASFYKNEKMKQKIKDVITVKEVIEKMSQEKISKTKRRIY